MQRGGDRGRGRGGPDRGRGFRGGGAPGGPVPGGGRGRGRGFVPREQGGYAIFTLLSYQTHVLSASLRRASPPLSTLALLTRPRTG